MVIYEDNFYKYDFENGKIWSKYWKKFVGGSKKNNGYIQFNDLNDGKNKFLHRLIFEKYHGSIQNHLHINHINGKKDDNRIVNLELVSNKENGQHRIKQSNNTTGQKNICWNKKKKKFIVQFKIDGKTGYFGSFKKLDEAIIQRDKVMKELNKLGNRFILNYPET